jgi:hypothetical protein
MHADQDFTQDQDSIEERRRRRRRRAIIAGAVALALVGGGTAAYAYWTNTGTGSGSASTGSNTPVTVVQTSSVTNLRPGGPALTLSGNFTNPNDGPVYVANVTVSITSVTKATGAPSGTCDATDYTITNPTMTVGAQVPAGTAQGSWTGATIQFNNKATNQDGCKNATLVLGYSSN